MKMRGLMWLKPLVKTCSFKRMTVCDYMAMIAGGISEQYKNRASRIIKEALSSGQIVKIHDTSQSYVFVNIERKK